MVEEFIFIVTELNMLDIGIKIRNMEKEFKPDLMDHHLKVFICLGRSMEKGHLYGLMDPNMKEISMKTIFMERGLMSELMEGNMMESGKRIKWKAKEFSHYQMVGFILEVM